MDSEPSVAHHELPLRVGMEVAYTEHTLERLAQDHLESAGEASAEDLKAAMAVLLEVAGRWAVALTTAGNPNVGQQQCECLCLLVPGCGRARVDGYPAPLLLDRLGEETAHLVAGTHPTRLKKATSLRQHGLLFLGLDLTYVPFKLFRIRIPKPADLRVYFSFPPDPDPEPLQVKLAPVTSTEEPCVECTPRIVYSEPGRGADGIWLKQGLSNPFAQLSSEQWAGVHPEPWTRPRSWDNGPVKWYFPYERGFSVAADDDRVEQLNSVLERLVPHRDGRPIRHG